MSLQTLLSRQMWTFLFLLPTFWMLRKRRSILSRALSVLFIKDVSLAFEPAVTIH